MKQLNILIACEYSGAVREAFRKLGHNAISCDLLESEDNSPFHYQGNVFDIIKENPLKYLNWLEQKYLDLHNKTADKCNVSDTKIRTDKHGDVYQAVFPNDSCF